MAPARLPRSNRESHRIRSPSLDQDGDVSYVPLPGLHRPGNPIRLHRRVSVTPDYDGLKAAIVKLSQGDHTHGDLLVVVHFSRAIVEAFLRVKMDNLRYLYAGQGLTETDVAYDCIAELFHGGDGREYPKLNRFAASLYRPIAEIPAVELFVAWRSLLTRVAKGHIAEMFHAADPVGGRIHRNIRDCVKRFPDLRVVDSPWGLCLRIEPARTASRGNSLPPEVLDAELSRRMGGRDGTAQLLGHVRDILASDELHGGRIRLFDIVQIVKKRYGTELGEAAMEMDPRHEGLTKSDVALLREECLAHVKEKIFLTYLGKGKLSRREATALYDTVASVVDDWSAGVDGDRSLQDRLTDFLAFDGGEYASRYRTKLEYLVKTARESLVASLSREI